MRASGARVRRGEHSLKRRAPARAPRTPPPTPHPPPQNPIPPSPQHPNTPPPGYNARPQNVALVVEAFRDGLAKQGKL